MALCTTDYRARVQTLVLALTVHLVSRPYKKTKTKQNKKTTTQKQKHTFSYVLTLKSMFLFFSMFQCSTLYTRLRGEPIGQYRFFKSRIRNTCITSEEGISTCLACPKVRLLRWLSARCILICTKAIFFKCYTEIYLIIPNNLT